MLGISPLNDPEFFCMKSIPSSTALAPRLLLSMTMVAALAACSGEQPATSTAGTASPTAEITAAPAPGEREAIRAVDSNRLRNAGVNNTDWLSHGRTWSEQRNSPLDRVNRNNVSQLGLAWDFELDTDRGQQATPLVIDGVIYFTSAWSKAFAPDARTGEELWRYDPQVPGAKAVDACCDVVNRGMAAWGDKV
jgi:glucose dehydrogenase